MALLYKTLFQINFLHEFYLTTQEGKSVFDEPSQQDRNLFMMNEFTLGHSAINDDLEFSFPEVYQDDYDDYGLRVIPSYSGFRVVIRVNRAAQEDGSVLFEPVQALPGDLRIYVLARKRNQSTDRYSWSPLFSETPCNYFLSNENLGGSRTFPFLNLNVPANDSSLAYEQGEVTDFGTGDLRQYYKGITGDSWQPIKGISYVTRADRILAPSRFVFSFVQMPMATSASFTLEDSNGNEVLTQTIPSMAANRKAALDFSSLPSSSISSGLLLYNLRCQGNNGEQYQQEINFHDGLYSTLNWGVVGMEVLPDDNRYRLLDENGFLLKRIESNGIWTEAPVFEIAIKSRFPFWRFRNHHNRELDLTTALQDFLIKEDGLLITQKPVSMTRRNFFVSDLTGLLKKYLPNPVAEQLIMDEKKRLCFEIRVPESALFPVVP